MLKKKEDAIGLQFVGRTQLVLCLLVCSGSVITYAQVASKMKYAAFQSSWYWVEEVET